MASRPTSGKSKSFFGREVASSLLALLFLGGCVAADTPSSSSPPGNPNEEAASAPVPAPADPIVVVEVESSEPASSLQLQGVPLDELRVQRKVIKRSSKRVTRMNGDLEGIKRQLLERHRMSLDQAALRYGWSGCFKEATPQDKKEARRWRMWCRAKTRK